MDRMDPFAHERYELRRRFFNLVHTNFFIHGPGGEVALFGRKRGFRLKEDIRLYGDEALQREILSIQARQVLDFSASYDVIDSREGKQVGTIQRKGLRSILRDEWHILDAAERPLAIVQEDSAQLALVRRFLSNLVPQSFHISMGSSTVGVISQHFNPIRLRLSIDFSLDSRRQLDRRLGLAVAALLGTIEKRQD
jgi:hypothetical protein